MKIGCTTTSFRQIRNREKIVILARDCGADVVEWGGDIHVKSVADALNAKAMCDAARVGISSYGSYYRVGSEKTDDWRNICEIAAAMGCGSVRVWLLGASDSAAEVAALAHPVGFEVIAVDEDHVPHGLLLSR